jgi:hypothetical protein
LWGKEKYVFFVLGLNGKAPDEKIYPPTLPDVEDIGKRQEVNNAIEDNTEDRKKEKQEQQEEQQKKEQQEKYLPQLVDIVDEVFEKMDTEPQTGNKYSYKIIINLHDMYCRVQYVELILLGTLINLIFFTSFTSFRTRICHINLKGTVSRDFRPLVFFSSIGP